MTADQFQWFLQQIETLSFEQLCSVEEAYTVATAQERKISGIGCVTISQLLEHALDVATAREQYLAATKRIENRKAVLCPRREDHGWKIDHVEANRCHRCGFMPSNPEGAR